MAIWAMRACYYFDFAFHSSTQVHRVNEIGRHRLGYVRLFSPQNRRFDRQLDHNIQYNRNTFTPVFDAVTSEGISDPLGMLSEAWNATFIIQQFQITMQSSSTTEKSIGCMGCAKYGYWLHWHQNMKSLSRLVFNVFNFEKSYPGLIQMQQSSICTL